MSNETRGRIWWSVPLLTYMGVSASWKMLNPYGRWGANVGRHYESVRAVLSSRVVQVEFSDPRFSSVVGQNFGRFFLVILPGFYREFFTGFSWRIQSGVLAQTGVGCSIKRLSNRTYVRSDKWSIWGRKSRPKPNRFPGSRRWHLWTKKNPRRAPKPKRVS